MSGVPAILSALLTVQFLLVPVISRAVDQERPRTLSVERGQFELDGTVQVSARASLDLGALPEGDYSVVTAGPTLRSTRGSLRWKAGELSVRPFAGLSAWFTPPGWEQIRHRERRGWIQLFSGISGATGWWMAASQLDDARDLVEAGATGGARQDALAEVFDEDNVRDLWMTFTLAVWAGSSLEAWALTPAPQLRDAPTGERFVSHRASRGQAFLRSLLVPGSGQRHRGREGRAALYSFAVTASAAAAILAQDSFLEARRERTSLARAAAATPSPQADARLQDARDTEDRRSAIRWTISGMAAGFYALQLIDALIGDAEESSGTRTSWRLLPRRDGVDLTLSIPLR